MGQEQALPKLEEDHYATHLADVNDSDNAVISTQDIVNSNGVLLCKKGMRISRKIADRLTGHQLNTSLEDSVKLSNSITNANLYGRILELLDRYPDLKQIHESANFSQECKNLFIHRKIHPILIQKLTVIQERLPEHLDKGIFCAWLAGLMAREMDMNMDDLHAAFLAGLTHDLGFIHISPDILNKKGALDAKEWRAIQSHVVVGKMVLEKLPDTPPGTARAILEHHERCDGSGYPQGRNDQHLAIMGQLIGIVDSIYSIRVHQFENKKRNLMDLEPWLHMNDNTHFFTVYQTLYGILKKSGLSHSVDHNTDISQMARTLQARGNALRQAVDLIQEQNVLGLLEGSTDSLVSQSLYKVINHLLEMTTRSGLVKEELFSWLNNIEKHPDQEALGELNQIELMLNELQWQLQNTCKVCSAFIEQDKGNSTRSRSIEEISGKIRGYLDQLQA